MTYFLCGRQCAHEAHQGHATACAPGQIAVDALKRSAGRTPFLCGMALGMERCRYRLERPERSHDAH